MQQTMITLRAGTNTKPGKPHTAEDTKAQNRLKRLMLRRLLVVLRVREGKRAAIRRWKWNAAAANKRPANRTDHNVVCTQAAVIKCMEKDIDRKTEEEASIKLHLGAHKIAKALASRVAREVRAMAINVVPVGKETGAELQRIVAEIGALSAKNKECKCGNGGEGLENSYKKNLKINVDQLEEKKMSMPPSQATDITSAGSHLAPMPLSMHANPTATIAEAKEYLEFSNTGDNLASKEAEEEEGAADGMTYLMSAEEQV